MAMCLNKLELRKRLHFSRSDFAHLRHLNLKL